MSPAQPLTQSVLSTGSFRSSAATHPGAVRDHNEDSFVNRPDLGLWAVADGAGGHQSGEVAASLVADTLRAVPTGLTSAQLLAETRLRIAAAHRRLQEEALRRGNNDILATTVVALLARGDHYACLWAGDSRAYLLRGGALIQLSHDHSFVQELVDAGEITPAEAARDLRANIITRAVGGREETLTLDKATNRLHAGDRFLLCSDGVSKTLAEDEIHRLLAADDAAAANLIEAALAAQADDNVTAVTIEVLGGTY